MVKKETLKEATSKKKPVKKETKKVKGKETKVLKSILVKIKNIILYPFKLIFLNITSFVKLIIRKSKEFKSEIAKVRWPNKKEMVKYSIATICFVVFFAVFFGLIELLMAFLKGLV